MQKHNTSGASGPDPAARRRSSADLQSLLDLLLASAVLLLAWEAFRPEPLRFLGLTLDRLSAVLAVLVTGIGSVVFRYSVRCLEGHPRRGRFLACLAGAVVAATVLVCATNLLVLLGAWTASSLCLHGLLTFCRERPEHRRPAWKKFIISRLGDVALLAAVLLLHRHCGTFDIPACIDAVREAPDAPWIPFISVLIVLAALTKSAQVPFHTWLPETMESPTPVSALMHAGIINAGGVLLVRFAPLVSQVPAAWVLLIAVGTATMSLGLVSMWAQVKVKRTLAWSTVAQMGFMMVQCGLQAWPAAVLHIVGHGCYKAWCFLRCGEVVDDRTPPIPPVRALLLVGAGIAASIAGFAIAIPLTGVDPRETPGEAALGGMLAVAIGQLWAAILGPRPVSAVSLAARTVGVLAGGTMAIAVALGLYGAARGFLLPVLGPSPGPEGALPWIGASVPVLATLALCVVHALLPVLHRRPAGRAFHVHALHGFYLGAAADRLVDSMTVTRPQPSHGGIDV